MNTKRRRIMREAWRLAKLYWTSEEKWSAWGLLLAVVSLNLGSVYIGVRINEWNRAFYNALQTFDSAELFRQLGLFAILVAVAISISVNALYLNQMLQIRWRRWLTRKYLASWLVGRAYHHLQFLSTTDNPDQRIAEDLGQFTGYVMNLSVGLISSAASMVSFLIILWSLSGPADIPLGNWGTVHIPAYLVWAALLYAGVGSWITIKIGRPLVPLNFARQRFEADFRFSLVRLRENAENVAFYGGETVENGIFQERFGSVFTNFWQIMHRQRRLNWFTQGYSQVAAIFPVVVIAPRYFGKLITLGGLMQVVNAFSFVQNALSFIINSYPDIAALQAVTQRLIGFEERLLAVHKGICVPRQVVIRRGGTGVSIKDLDLDRPDGTALLRGVSFEAAHGEALLITGPNGAGKTTLFRAIAVIWPFARGEIRLGEGRIFFVPQRSYFPLGTLAGALLYPLADRLRFSTPQLIAALEEVGLGAVAGELDIVENWPHRLSLGEQQRLVFARILLAKPTIIFLDEATSGVDQLAESRLYGLLREAPWRPTVLSIGHRSELRNFHDRVLDLSGFRIGQKQASSG
jgi:vitamin B12/bleomycin/antimicrobial peptide transport system ATP-binding/permease protein